MAQTDQSGNDLLGPARQACLEGDWRRARSMLRCQLGRSRRSPAALHLAGVVSLQQEQPLRAVVLLERGLALNSADASMVTDALILALGLAANRAAQAQHWSRTIRLCKRSLELKPDQVHALSNLAVAQLRSDQIPLALTTSKRALALAPVNPEVLNNHATILQEQGEFTTADALYQLVLELAPDHPHALANRACIAHQRGSLQQAEALYGQHLSRHPADTRAHVNLAGVLLSQGKWLPGWEAYEARLNEAERIMTPPAKMRRWRGHDDPVTKLVLVHEQGFGDCFQFSRYLPLTKAASQQTIFSGPVKLHGILRRSRLVDRFMTENQLLKDQDKRPEAWTDAAWAPLLSLPLLLKQIKPGVTQAHPYLQTRRDRIDRWTLLQQGSMAPVIALHWQGNPDHEFTLSRGRSLPLQQLRQLLEIKAIRWLSLQKGPGSNQLDALGWRDHFHPAQACVDNCWDFEDTAAILMNCDLVISSDSGLAHLAAALGRPTWLLLMHIPEWRWGLQGDHTPWYPNMRLFRQKQRGDWSGLVQRQLLPALQKWRSDWTAQQG